METRIMSRFGDEVDGSSKCIESETVNSPPARHRQASCKRKDEQLDSAKPASLLTPGDGNDSSKPSSPSRLGRPNGNRRLKRFAARRLEDTFEYRRRKREMREQVDTFRGQPGALGHRAPGLLPASGGIPGADQDLAVGEVSCKAVPYVEVVSLGVATFTLCALCVDRLRGATNVQMHYETVENCASTAAKLAVIWIGALLLALPELLIHQLVPEAGAGPGAGERERCEVRISPDLPDTVYVLGLTYEGARLWWHFGCYFCLPTLFTAAVSLETARRIRRAEKAGVRGSRERVRAERQMTCAVVALAVLYGVCVIPENARHAVAAHMAARVPRRAADLLRLASQLLLIARAAATPVLLFCVSRPFGRAFLECCCCCCRRRPLAGPQGPHAAAGDPERSGDLELEPAARAHAPANSAAATATSC
ncbi:hypothetical protein COCON_G00228570 [Conger conger]|uniref:G-protein coupled receptors family 1 profile domain-containing protein n=1 Tax=Conger conger TaxID=82655 RepID=A0A9Q1CV26_CONCO|nr:hypothetical protein COCON_G00228570 [Conger conger]